MQPGTRFLLEADKSLAVDKGLVAVARSSAAKEEPSVDPMISVSVNLGQRVVGHYMTFGPLSDGRIPKGEWRLLETTW